MDSTRSEQADKIYKLLCDGKIFEAKIESLALGCLLRLDVRCEEFLKKLDADFAKLLVRK